MKTLTTTGRQIKATANHSKRTFTIRTDSAKYRTNKMDKEEFQSCLYNTASDWNQFLKSEECYAVK